MCTSRDAAYTGRWRFVAISNVLKLLIHFSLKFISKSRGMEWKLRRYRVCILRIWIYFVNHTYVNRMIYTRLNINLKWIIIMTYYLKKISLYFLHKDCFCLHKEGDIYKENENLYTFLTHVTHVAENRHKK